MPMTEFDATREADKRNKHKSKFMSHKTWRAAHNSTKGWHVALEDTIKGETKQKLETGDDGGIDMKAGLDSMSSTDKRLLGYFMMGALALRK